MRNTVKKHGLSCLMKYYVYSTIQHCIAPYIDNHEKRTGNAIFHMYYQHRCQTFAHAYVCSRNTCLCGSALAVPTTTSYRRLSKTQTFNTTFKIGYENQEGGISEYVTMLTGNETMHGLPTLTFQWCSCNMENCVALQVQYK